VLILEAGWSTGDPSFLGFSRAAAEAQCSSMWSELRADAGRRQLAAIARSGLDAADVQAAAIEVVGRVVPFDATCWGTVDPDTMLLNGSVTVAFDPGPALEALFVEIESAGGDLNPFHDLAARPVGVARLSDAGGQALANSRRVHEIWQPLGVAHEVRVAFTAAERCWGVAGLLRGGDSPDFSDTELAFLSSVSPTIALALRASLIRPAPSTGNLPLGPGVVVLSPDGEVQSATAAARELLGDRAHTVLAGIAVRSLVGAVKTGADSARARLQAPDGTWLLLQASLLTGSSPAGQVVVTVAPASARDLTALLLDAHGLSRREQDVCLAVLAGESTAAIAASLYISPNTVQDHLKSIFDKVGVRSRRALTAHLRPV
jgi:DNA-binding CsgD family transcriptional regulator